MHRTAIISIVLIAVFAFSSEADARRKNVSPGGEYSFQLESQGRVLPVHNHKGISYVEGTWGAHYSIRVFNHSSKRIEAVVTVDGRDVITGQVGNYRTQRGYVINPYGSVLIEGFRRSWNNVAAFRFTDVGDSYAARMGNASNVGVIGVAVFKEKIRPRPRPRPPIAYGAEQNQGTGYGGAKSKRSAPAPKRGRSGSSDSAGPARSAPAYDMDDELEEDSSQGLGTEYGHDTYSPATKTKFVRHSRRPNAALAIHYDDHQGLVAKGVLPRPRPRPRPRPTPQPFPNSPDPGFAPPPPTYYWD